MPAQEYKAFDVKTVALNGASLIEASAGTGKTYSIAILVLRLLLEKKFSIQEILMVTFTNAAVAELQDRIRKFVRDAYRYANGGEIEDKTIGELIDNADREESKRLLRTAIINLDEVAVLTIHGFCQQTLNEFAFETKQLFSADVVQDVAEILNEEVQKFWRENITGIPTDLLSFLIGLGLNQEKIVAILKGHLANKGYLFFNPDETYIFDKEKQEEFYRNIMAKWQSAEDSRSALLSYFAVSRDLIFRKCIAVKNKTTQNALLSKAGDPDALIEYLNKKRDSDFVSEFSVLLALGDTWNKNLEDFHTEVDRCANYLYSFAIQTIAKSIEERKILSGQLSFDDMIGKLHQALAYHKNPDLERALQNKYKAVFIDEFQDTDKLQFEIFKTAFQDQSDTILFYIGDPKQSIYSFRTADIFTYFKARESVGEKLYTMTVNYRSTQSMTEALNQFFLPDASFDTFYFEDEPEKIQYIPVSAFGRNNRYFARAGVPDSPVSISFYKNQPSIRDAVSLQILELLTNPDLTIPDKITGRQRSIIPSDIGVLVRGHDKGADVKKALVKRGIPAVVVTDAKVLQSSEAQELVYVLKAFNETSRSNINRALMTGFARYSSNEIRMLNQEKAIQLFSSYHVQWLNSGVFTALMRFIKDFGIQQKLISSHTEDGERILTNLYHLTEILNKAETRRHMNSEELISWFSINIQNPKNAEDEWEQRIESDEQAVKIATIHKSKGLEYNIVFLPNLDLRVPSNPEIVSFRDKNGDYKTGEFTRLSDEDIVLYRRQEEQENRRLIYVALTRAVYKCFIYSSSHLKESSLKTFTNKITYNDLIAETPAPTVTSDWYKPQTKTKQEVLRAAHSHLKENNWLRMSYTSLAAGHEARPKESYHQEEESYDRFIFRDLRRGAKTGNFLHYIFEGLNFSRPETWENTLSKAIQRFEPQKKDDPDFTENILRLVTHVMNTSLHSDDETFQLRDIQQENTLHELEFDFPVPEFHPQELTQPGLIGISDIWQGRWQGLMNGKVDLFFKHGDKYYILDWKSNYLGPTIHDYSTVSVEQAMTENNYHLQYMIYVLAIKKYLQSRLGVSFDFERDFGGVFYLFLRGIRSGQGSGVFFARPSAMQIRQIEEIITPPVIVNTHQDKRL